MPIEQEPSGGHEHHAGHDSLPQDFMGGIIGEDYSRSPAKAQQGGGKKGGAITRIRDAERGGHTVQDILHDTGQIIRRGQQQEGGKGGGKGGGGKKGGKP